MSTRANVYLEENFLYEVPGSAYPGGDFWDLMIELDRQECGPQEFIDAVLKFADGDTVYIGTHYGGDSNGVGNWSYEYMWVPTKRPVPYNDWNNWRGRVLVRQPDRGLRELLGDCYVRIGGPWQLIRTYVLRNE